MNQKLNIEFANKFLFLGHKQIVRDVVFLGQNSSLLASSSDDGIRIWSLKTKSLVKHFQGQTIHYLLKYFPGFPYKGKKRNLLVASSNDKRSEIKIIDIDELKIIKTFYSTIKNNAFTAYDSELIYNQQLLVSCNYSGTIHFWNLNHCNNPNTPIFSINNKTLQSGQLAKWACIYLQTLSLLVYSDTNSNIYFFNFLKKKVIASLLLSSTYCFQMKQFQLENGRLFLICCNQRQILFIDPVKFTLICKGDFHTNQVRGLDFSPKFNLIVTVSCDKYIAFWDVNKLLENEQNGDQSIPITPSFTILTTQNDMLNCCSIRDNTLVLGSWDHSVVVQEIEVIRENQNLE